MSNRRSHFVRRFRTLPSAPAGVSGPGSLLALAAVLALLALMLQPTAEQAQTPPAQTEVWSATLTVEDTTPFGSVFFRGYHGGSPDVYPFGILSDDDFDFLQTSITSGPIATQRR